MKISTKQGRELLEVLESKGTLTKELEKITPTITAKTYKLEGWEYKCLYFKGELKKVEEFNHRELIEIWVD